MLIHCSPSLFQNSKSSRLVYKGTDAGPVDVLDPYKTPEALPAAPDTRSQLAYARTEVVEGVRSKLSENQDVFRQLAEELSGQEYGTGDANWRQWNEAFAKKVDLGDDKKASSREQVAALQRVVFTELGLLGKDPAAVVDGLLGPYTRAALARFAKLPPDKIKVPEGANALAAKVSESYETAEAEKERTEREAEAEQERIESEKRTKTVEAAGKLDPAYEWYLVESGTSPTGYEMKKWKPIKAGVPDVQRANREQLNTQKIGQTISLDIEGVPVKMTYVRAGVFKLEGVEGEMDMATMYRKAIELARAKREAEKPKGDPAASKASKKQSAPLPLVPPNRPDLAFLEWDPGKTTLPNTPANPSAVASAMPSVKPRTKEEEEHAALRRQLLAQTLKDMGLQLSNEVLAMLEPHVFDVSNPANVQEGLQRLQNLAKKRQEGEPDSPGPKRIVYEPPPPTIRQG